MENAVIQKVSINEQVYQYLKELIINDKLKPNEKIGVAECAQALGVSRMPVNTALSRLQNEGYVVIQPQSGSYVRELSGEELRIIFRVRAGMEREILVSYGDRLDRRKLQDYRRKFSALFEAESCSPEILMENFELDVSFHLFIVHACPEIILREVIKIMDLTKRCRILQVQKLIRKPHANMRELEIKTHIDIIDAILSQEYAEAGERIYRDILDTWERVQ